MNEEELFCKLFPEYAVNGKPLSPYFDLFESGFEQAEKRIEELEKENAELKADNDARKFAMAMSEKVEKQLRNERNTFLAQNEQYEKDLIDFNEQLTKAKEIIKYLLSFIQKENYKTRWDINITAAEQFLKSEVEK